VAFEPTPAAIGGSGATGSAARGVAAPAGLGSTSGLPGGSSAAGSGPTSGSLHGTVPSALGVQGPSRLPASSSRAPRAARHLQGPLGLAHPSSTGTSSLPAGSPSGSGALWPLVLALALVVLLGLGVLGLASRRPRRHGSNVGPPEPTTRALTPARARRRITRAHRRAARRLAARPAGEPLPGPLAQAAQALDELVAAAWFGPRPPGAPEAEEAQHLARTLARACPHRGWQPRGGQHRGGRGGSTRQGPSGDQRVARTSPRSPVP
jgi:hypothetical protein